ncbi:MAG: hypothetical protein KAI57_02810 [Candidatus Pacebacteria bacterium]|nr:hypothetical protein [Candidatus Paceibacterota bacterium]
MATLYDKKVVISGKIIEVYKYSKMQVYGFTAFPSNKGFEKNEEEKNRSKFSQSRSSFNIRGLVNSNPDLNKFLTLTFAKNQKNLSKANYEFKKFIERMKYKYQIFKYVCVVEFQKRGAVHYHIICNLTYIKKKTIEKIWSHGFVKINRVQSVRNLGAYFAKHGTKGDEVESKLLASRKKFFCSRGINRPIILRNPDKTKEYIDKNLQNKVAFFRKNYKKENLEIDYTQFKV